MRMFRLSFGLALPLLVGCGGPLWLIPGGALTGNDASVPAEWSHVSAIETIALETRTTDPYSVNIWSVVSHDQLYVIAVRGSGSKWTNHIAQDPRVRIRVAESVYALKALAVRDRNTIESVYRDWGAKYDYTLERIETRYPEAIVYRQERS